MERDRIQKIVSSLRELQEQGEAMHREYDLQSNTELHHCVKENLLLRDRAKALRDEAQGLASARFRMDIVLAADAAFSCVYCSGDGSTCAGIPRELERVEAWLASEED